MDENNRRRRQHDPPYPGPDPRFNADPNQARGFTTSSTDRFRPTPITTSPSTSRGVSVGGAVAYSGYYQEPTSAFPGALSQGAMQYQAGYPQDQRQQQNFNGYNPDIMYNVPPQSQQSNVYDTNSQFQTRQPAAIQLLSDVATPYFPAEAAGAAPPQVLQHPGSATSSSAYQQHQGSPAGRNSLPQSYQGNLTMGSISSNVPELMPDEDFQAEGPGMEVAYTAYQTALKEVFQNIINCRLAEASRSLLEVSEWLLGHVGDLGLTVDETALHADRIRLWGEFNTAWLGIFQKQKDLLESGQRLQQLQSLMSQDFTRKMAKDLIRMCDAIEKHGLVDYQYGVAEEQIIAILEECLDLQQSLEGVGGVPVAGRESN